MLYLLTACFQAMMLLLPLEEVNGSAATSENFKAIIKYAIRPM